MYERVGHIEPERIYCSAMLVVIAIEAFDFTV
jgi:hypothetical protein